MTMDQSCSKSTFESLGIVMEDGKPKFRLNEPAFSTINIPLSTNFDDDDDDDDNSFVVLGKSSLDFINNASLIDYKQIQEKSMAVDYNSIISALSHEEIESKITQLLRENVKLKETLLQNNKAMKNHFNKLVSWQEELMKVHGNHKQKFAETRNMITLLQQENTELKNKLTSTGSIMCSHFSRESWRESCNQNENNMDDHVKLLNTMDSLNSSTQNTVTNNEYEVNNEVDIKTKKLLELTERQNHELHYRDEIISSLKAQLQLLIEDSFKPIESRMENTIDTQSNKNRHQFLDNFMHYNKKLATVVKCYAAQTSRFTNIQDCLKQCIDILKAIVIDSTMEIKEETIKTLDDCRKQLINEQIRNITERQNFIVAQNQFQKIFSDYNSALHELEILREENGKPLRKIDDLTHEQEELMKNMKIIENEKNQLDSMKEKLIAEQTIFKQQQDSLEEAKASLNSQSILYETEMKNLQDNMKIIQKRHDDMLEFCTKSKEQLELKNIELEGIKARLNIARKDAENITILQQQLDLYKSDFKEEEKAKLQLIDEREYLTDQLGKLRDHNQQLLHKLNGRNPTPLCQESDEQLADSFCYLCGLYKIPGQWHGPGCCQPID